MSKEKKDKAKKYKEKKSHIVRRTLMAVVIVACIVAGFSYVQSERLKQGLVDVCAMQQDAYVQLVLDQIYLKENRDNQEIIEEILGTLDASSNKYWTFSDDQTMLFVKDVLETNKYKGFTAATYFVSDSAKEFFNSLKMNKVTHSVVMIDESQYIASGVVFSYGGGEYKLCLLTNKMVLLDNNELLRATTEMAVLIFAVTALFALTALCFGKKVMQLQEELGENQSNMTEMNRHIEKLNDEISKWDIHDTRRNLWKKESLLGFAEKLQERGTYPVTLALLQVTDVENMQDFWEAAHYVLDRSVLRFAIEEDCFLFMFVQCDREDAKYSLRSVKKYVEVVDMIVIDEKSEEDLYTCCWKILGGA